MRDFLGGVIEVILIALSTGANSRQLLAIFAGSGAVSTQDFFIAVFYGGVIPTVIGFIYAFAWGAARKYVVWCGIMGILWTFIFPREVFAPLSTLYISQAIALERMSILFVGLRLGHLASKHLFISTLGALAFLAAGSYSLILLTPLTAEAEAFVGLALYLAAIVLVMFFLNDMLRRVGRRLNPAIVWGVAFLMLVSQAMLSKVPPERLWKLEILDFILPVGIALGFGYARLQHRYGLPSFD